MEKLDDERMAIEKAKETFNSHGIKSQLATVKVNFEHLVKAIMGLEERVPLVRGLEIVKNMQKSLTLEPSSKKLSDLLPKNPGFEHLEKVARIIRGEGDDLDLQGMDPNMPS